MVGTVTDKAVARAGQPVVRPMLPLCVSLDHRFVDGYQAASMARIFRQYLADPAKSDPVPLRRSRQSQRNSRRAPSAAPRVKAATTAVSARLQDRPSQGSCSSRSM
jgi:2-oxoacid dehydrogenase/acyltransferase catalytic subunit